MRKILKSRVLPMLLLAALVLSTVYFLLFDARNTVPAMAHPARFWEATVIIDAGHGGEDGGAVSPAGTIESHINLAVARRLDGLLGLFGADVVLLRSEDISLHDAEAKTLRAKKISDLHNRVATIEATANATLISIHQNTYDGNAKYHGAQVFYGNNERSRPLAQFTQAILRAAIDPENTRCAAKIPGSVYLMKHITCPAILVECGFLSNPAEDALLQLSGYQTKLAAALAGAYLSYDETN